MRSAFSKYPFFLILLPVFFVLHGFFENRGLVPMRDAGILALFYIGIGLAFFLLFLPFFRNTGKAGILAFLFLACQFFFGSIQDLLKKYFEGTFAVRYSFLVPLICLGLILAFVWLKKTRKEPYRLVLYLNTLMMILLLAELFTSFFINKERKDPNPVPVENFRVCDTCPKPDIYLVLADGYPGQKELKDQFDFDNSSFISQLNNRGFFVADSSFSNYNFTAFSLASLLNLNYLPDIKGNNNDKQDIAICLNAIRTSQFSRCLEENGYTVLNHSIFDLDGHPSHTRPTFLPQKTLPITAQTFTRRIARDLWYHLATTLKISSVISRYKNHDRSNTEKMYALTWEEPAIKRDRPKFIYTHLMMPHHPLYFDSAGHAYPLSRLVDGHYYDKSMRIGYLHYSNRKILELCDRIRSASSNPPVILLLGDHGIREFREPVDPGYSFLTLQAILLPGREYEGYYNGMSHVNFIRNFLNRQMGQQLKPLPDSTILIRE